MSGLELAVTGARADPSALVPTLAVGLRITAPAARRVQSVLLRCQIRVEPQRRRYSEQEQGHLLDVFGAPERWATTVTPFLLTHVTVPVRGFAGDTEIDLPVEISYDLEVTAGKYLHALRDGAVPLLFLFSGSVFYTDGGNLQVEQIPWDREARYELPLAVWTAAIDAHYPGTAWLRLRRETVDALLHYKSRHALPTWDAVVTQLLHDGAIVTPGPPESL